MKKLRILLSILITVIILYFFLRNTPLSLLKEKIWNIQLHWLIGFILLSLLCTLFRVLRYGILLESRINFWTLLLIVFVRNFSVDLLPAHLASLAFYTYFVKREGGGWEEGGGSFVLAVLYDFLSLLPLVILVGILFFASEINMINLIFLSIFLLLISLVILLTLPNIILFLKKIIPESRTSLKELLQNMSLYFKRSGELKKSFLVFGLSILVRATKYLSLFVLFHSVSGFSSIRLVIFPKFFFTVVSAELSSYLPIQGISGIGSWELVFSLASKMTGLSCDNPFLLGLLLHSITQLWEYSIGILAFLYLTLRKKD